MADPFLGNSNTGLVYGRLQGINRHTLKTDIINLLEGCNLTLENVKVNYSHGYMPLEMLSQFPSPSAYAQASRVIARKGRLYKLKSADRAQWYIVTPYDGETLRLSIVFGFMHNFGKQVLALRFYCKVERFLSGFENDQTSLNFFNRAAEPDVRMAIVRFPTKTQAMNALIQKNGTFCLNNRVSVRVLQ